MLLTIGGSHLTSSTKVTPTSASPVKLPWRCQPAVVTRCDGPECVPLNPATSCDLPSTTQRCPRRVCQPPFDLFATAATRSAAPRGVGLMVPLCFHIWQLKDSSQVFYRCCIAVVGWNPGYMRTQDIPSAHIPRPRRTTSFINTITQLQKTSNSLSSLPGESNHTQTRQDAPQHLPHRRQRIPHHRNVAVPIRSSRNRSPLNSRPRRYLSARFLTLFKCPRLCPRPEHELVGAHDRHRDVQDPHHENDPSHPETEQDQLVQLLRRSRPAHAEGVHRGADLHQRPLGPELRDGVRRAGNLYRAGPVRRLHRRGVSRRQVVHRRPAGRLRPEEWRRGLYRSLRLRWRK